MKESVAVKALWCLACLFSEAFRGKDILLHLALAVSIRGTFAASDSARVCSNGLAPSQWVHGYLIVHELPANQSTLSNAESAEMGRSKCKCQGC